MAVATAFPLSPVENIKPWNFSNNIVKLETKQRTHQKVVVLGDCKGCSERYSEERVPRNLKCGHCLCKICLEKCTTDEISCPECSQKQPTKDMKNFPVNYPLLRLIQSSDKKEVEIAYKSKAILADIFDNDLHKNISSCPIHGSALCLFCCTCNSWACHDCLVIDHACLPRGSCRVLGYDEAMKKINNKYTESATESSKEIDSMKNKFEFEISMHDYCLQHCTKERSHLRITERVESLLKGEKENNDTAVQKAREDLNKLNESVAKSTSPEELTSSITALFNFQKELPDTISQEKNRLSSAMPPMLKHLRMDLKSMAEGMQPVYTVMDAGEKSMCSLVEVRDQRILVHSLQEGKPPAGCITIPFGFIKNLVPKCWSTVFLEIGTAEQSLGRIYILMEEDTDRYLQLQQMVIMCTGEKGISYKNSTFYKYDEESGLLHGGDYEKNDGTGGKPIITGLGDCYTKSVYRYEGEKFYGTVLGNLTSTRFSFYMKHQSKEHMYDVIGKVSAGVHLLEAISKLESKSKAIIRDCGVVIPMTPKYSDENDCMDPSEEDCTDPTEEDDYNDDTGGEW